MIVAIIISAVLLIGVIAGNIVPFIDIKKLNEETSKLDDEDT
jgi:hypothetical protein